MRVELRRAGLRCGPLGFGYSSRTASVGVLGDSAASNLALVRHDARGLAITGGATRLYLCGLYEGIMPTVHARYLSRQ